MIPPSMVSTTWANTDPIPLPVRRTCVMRMVIGSDKSVNAQTNAQDHHL